MAYSAPNPETVGQPFVPIPAQGVPTPGGFTPNTPTYPIGQSPDVAGNINYTDARPVTMIDTGSAVKTVNNQKTFLDTTYPTPAPANNNGGSTTGAPTAPAPTGDAPKAFFTNAAGQEAEYTQDQLNDPNTAKFLKDNGYALTKTNGLNVSPDFTVAGKQAAADSAETDVENLTKNFMAYNVDQDPAFQSAAANITASYGKLIDAMKQTNAARQNSLTTLGLRSGTTQYSNGIQSGIMGEELKQADGRISDLVTQENTALSNAKLAYQKNEFTNFNEQVNALKDIRDQKAKALADYNTAIVNATKQVQTQLDQQTKNSDNLVKLAQNGVDLTADQLAAYDKNLGGTGMAQAIYDGAKQKQKNVDDLKFAQDLGKLPPGATVTRDGNTYTSTQEGKLTRITEKAKDGTFTTVFYNADGTIHSTSTGTAGNGQSKAPVQSSKMSSAQIQNIVGSVLQKNAAPNMKDKTKTFVTPDTWNQMIDFVAGKNQNVSSFVKKYASYMNPDYPEGSYKTTAQ